MNSTVRKRSGNAYDIPNSDYVCWFKIKIKTRISQWYQKGNV